LINVFGNTKSFDCQSWSSSIIGWNFNNPDLENFPIGGPNAKYDSIAALAREELLARGWTINGIETPDACGAVSPFSCQDSLIIGNDELFGNLLISTTQQIEINEVLIDHPASISFTAPNIVISSLEIIKGATVEIRSNIGCIP
jgi:hypothetical protein